MTDIDFDELDKAVNSLMQQHDEKEAEETEPSESIEVPADDTPSIPSLSSPATKRATGRFMDVMHPSSDMMSNHPPQPRASHVGISIQPSVDVRSSSDEEENVDPAVELVIETAPQVDLSEQDHLDTTVASLMADELRDTQTSPLESPFVQGAVVDKRPLGITLSDDTQSQGSINQPTLSGESSSGVEPTQSVQAIQDTEISQVQDAWAQEDSGDQLVTEPLVPELDKDLMALESSDPLTVEEPVEEKSNLSVPTSSSSITPLAGDILQQYTADFDSEAEPVPMYDAASSSPELAHKEKKKSGWLTVIMIVLLLIVGAGGGAAAWYFLL